MVGAPSLMEEPGNVPKVIPLDGTVVVSPTRSFFVFLSPTTCGSGHPAFEGDTCATTILLRVLGYSKHLELS